MHGHKPDWQWYGKWFIILLRWYGIYLLARKCCKSLFLFNLAIHTVKYRFYYATHNFRRNSDYVTEIPIILNFLSKKKQIPVLICNVLFILFTATVYFTKAVMCTWLGAWCTHACLTQMHISPEPRMENIKGVARLEAEVNRLWCLINRCETVTMIFM